MVRTFLFIIFISFPEGIILNTFFHFTPSSTILYLFTPVTKTLYAGVNNYKMVDNKVVVNLKVHVSFFERASGRNIELTVSEKTCFFFIFFIKDKYLFCIKCGLSMYSSTHSLYMYITLG